MVLALALFVGAVRFFRLGEWSLWLDEALTLADVPHAFAGKKNPLGYALFGWIYGLFPGRPNEFVMRLPAALLGWASIGLTAWAARPLVGRRAAAWAALVVAVSPWHIFWSQTARFYTLAMVLGTGGAGLLLRCLFQRPGLGDRRWLGRALLGLGLAVLAGLAHPSAAFLVGALILAPLLAWGCLRKGERGALRPIHKLLLAIGFGGALVASPWALSTWKMWSEVKGGGTPFHFALSSGFLVGPGLGIALLISGVRALRTRSEPSLVAFFVVAVGGGASLLAAAFLRVSAQYVFVLLPWFAALGCLELGRGGGSTFVRRLRIGLAALLVVPLAADTALYFSVRGGDRPAWRAAYRYVDAVAGAEDRIWGMDAPVGQYYLEPQQYDLRNWGHVSWLDSFRAAQVFAELRSPRTRWYVVNDELLEDWSGTDRDRMRAFLAEECELVWERRVGWTPRDLSVRVYRH